MRGSGTSGYVQTNKFNLRGGPHTDWSRDRDDDRGPVQKKPNAGACHAADAHKFVFKLRRAVARFLLQALLFWSAACGYRRSQPTESCPKPALATDILEHNRKREVELAVEVMRAQLEDEE